MLPPQTHPDVNVLNEFEYNNPGDALTLRDAPWLLSRLS
jgi:hypothetical protein